MAYHSIDPKANRAIYHQIADQLRRRLDEGILGPGKKLPSERQLMEEFHTARGTIRQAIAVLKSEGLIESEHGRGVFVRQKPPIRRKANTRFLRQHRMAGQAAFIVEAESEGRIPEVEILRLEPDIPPAAIAEALRLDPRSKALIRSRRYLADGFPVELATSYVPWKLARGTAIARANSGPGGIYARLEERGHRLDHFVEEVTARMPTPEEADQLQLGSGVPVIVLIRTAFDHEGTPVEVCDTTMASDRFVLSYRFPAE